MNTAERLRDQLEEEIVQGILMPGAHLDENALAKRFGVSRTPIREALTQLASVGFLKRRPRRGVVVAAVSSEQLLEMFQVMAELEALAARLTTRRLTDAHATEIKTAHEACRTEAEARARDRYYYANELFHRAVQQASQSGFLIEQCAALGRRLRPYRRLQLDVGNRIANSFGEHEAIVRAILEQDADRAGNLMRSHVLIQGERFGDLAAAVARQQQAGAH